MKKLLIITLILLFFINCDAIRRDQQKPSDISVSQNFHFAKYKRVTILPFISHTSKRYDYNISDQLTVSLMKRGYTVIERTQLEAILRELKIELTGLIDQSDMVRIGKLLKIDALIMGSFEDEGGWLKSSTMRMIDVATGELIVSIYSNAWNADIQFVVNDIMRLMDKVRLEQR
jgi:hypothetical protein